MLDRFTARAREVIIAAQGEARALHHNYIGTEHILLGLVNEGDGVGSRALDALGISLDAVRQQVLEIIGEGKRAPAAHIPFTPRSKKALDLALREAMQLDRLRREVRRLQGMLLRHGIEPGDVDQQSA
jgi:ATP-dependent Clp protease ATP-binding subunit ClpC